jgi:hypothetical protein
MKLYDVEPNAQNIIDSGQQSSMIPSTANVRNFSEFKV